MDVYDPDELELIQDGRFSYTVRQAADAPAYRERFARNGISPEDIEGIEDRFDIEITEQEDLLNNQPPVTDSFRYMRPEADIRRPLETSGTTGNPKVRNISYDDADRIFNDLKRGMEYFGIEEDDTVAVYFPFVGLNVSCFGTEGGFEEMGATTVPFSNTPYPLDVEAQNLQKYEPNVMKGLASHIDSKGMNLKDEGYDPESFGVEKIILAGEPVSESRKDHIGEIWDAEVYEYLGSTEGGAFAFECTEGDGLHVLEDSVYAEVLDEQDEPVEEGGSGSLVITNLAHPGDEVGTPLLRYRIGDSVELMGEDDCGCELEHYTKISPPSREEWGFVLGAVNLDPVFFEDLIYGQEGLEETVEDYRLELDYDPEAGKDALDIIVQSNEDEYVGQQYEDISLEDDSEAIVEELGHSILASHSHLWDTVDNVNSGEGAADINIEIVDSIDRSPGKPERLIDRR